MISIPGTMVWFLLLGMVLVRRGSGSVGEQDVVAVTASAQTSRS